MSPSELNQVVDNLADKLGVAASELGSVAETLVGETARLETWSACWYLVLAVALWCILPYAIKNFLAHVSSDLTDDVVEVKAVLCVIASCGALIFALVFTVEGLIAIGNVLSPTLTLLKTLL